MAFDGIVTYHLIQELSHQLLGGHIRKIHQPENDEIHLSINRGKTNYVLLMSANANQPRVHLTNKKKKNPNTPPSFCMALRKHLINGRIEAIRQHESDRVILLDIATKNEFGDPVIKSLIAEITGRHANIILTKTEADALVIIDCLKKIGSSSNRYRQILPGLPYKFPPETGRQNYFNCKTDADLDAWLLKHPHESLSHALVQGFLGVSPNLAREICFRSGLSEDQSTDTLSSKNSNAFHRSFLEIHQEITAQSSPCLYYFNHQIRDFATLSLHYLQSLDRQPADSVSNLLERFYYQKDKKNRFDTKSANLKHQLNILFKKNTKKLQNLHKDYQNSQKDEKSKLYGDLITANIYQIEKGMKSVTLSNYYDPELSSVTIPLKVNEAPSQNAQRFYKKYNKAKRAQIQVTEQIQKTENTVYYLESLLNALEHCTEPEELDEIRHEVIHSEFGNQKNKGKKDKRPISSHPLHFRSSEGFDILVGKNNYQNDAISTRLGSDEDCWLHVKDISGSHVLIIANGRFITEQTLLEAGALAAWYSKAKNSSNVPVDYVEYRYVHKPNKAKPGMVVFTNQNTMYITPKREIIDQIETVTKA